ncbi:MAG TPA: cupin domain-containing protein [Desulfurococcales archaeon]|nr:cupin domain-containing protein [Desulfurococcales archaeon]
MLPHKINIFKIVSPSDKVVFRDVLSGKNTLYKSISLRLLRIPPLTKFERGLERLREQVYIVLEGSGKILFKEYNKTISIERGDIVYIPPAYTHTIINTGDYEMSILIVSSPP